MADTALRRRPSTMIIRWPGWLLPAAILLGACQADRPTGAAPVPAVVLAKGTGSTSGSTAPTVTATSPMQAAQDTTLDVTVTGSGFATGARATWVLNGDTTLVVPASAPVAQYDVQIMLVDGKKGVGVELFAVTLGDPTATFSFPLADSGLGVRSDHKYVSGDASVYAAGVCGVTGRVFATTVASNSGDALIHTYQPSSVDRKCADYPRKMTIDLGNGMVESTSAGMNLNQMQNTLYRIPVDSTVKRGLNLGQSWCNGMAWKAVLPNGTATGADSVLVTRTSLSRWQVRTQPAPLDKAYCTADGRTYHVPVSFTVTTSRPLP